MGVLKLARRQITGHNVRLHANRTMGEVQSQAMFVIHIFKCTLETFFLSRRRVDKKAGRILTSTAVRDVKEPNVYLTNLSARPVYRVRVRGSSSGIQVNVASVFVVKVVHMLSTTEVNHNFKATTQGANASFAKSGLESEISTDIG